MNAIRNLLKLDIPTIVDEMVGEPDCFDNWLSDIPCPPSVAGLLSLILEYGLPRNNESEVDNELCGVYETRIQCVRSDFEAWAGLQSKGKSWGDCPAMDWVKAGVR